MSICFHKAILYILPEVLIKMLQPQAILSGLNISAAYEQAVREQRMRTEISQAKRENTHYLASVEKGKEIEAIVQRKRKRGATEEEVGWTLRMVDTQQGLL